MTLPRRPRFVTEPGPQTERGSGGPLYYISLRVSVSRTGDECRIEAPWRESANLRQALSLIEPVIDGTNHLLAGRDPIREQRTKKRVTVHSASLRRARAA